MKKRRKPNNVIKIQKKVIRCKAQNKPVFEHEFCSQFVTKESSNNQNNCGNCKHAFWCFLNKLKLVRLNERNCKLVQR